MINPNNFMDSFRKVMNFNLIDQIWIHIGVEITRQKNIVHMDL
jgi:hypothetical protein